MDKGNYQFFAYHFHNAFNIFSSSKTYPRPGHKKPKPSTMVYGLYKKDHFEHILSYQDST